MLYKEKTKFGDIKINKQILTQLVKDSVKPYLLKLKPLSEKSIYVSQNGIFISINVSIALGESLSLVCDGIINFLSRAILDDLQLRIDDIIVSVDSVYTSKGNSSPRSMVVKYSEKKISIEGN